MVDQPPPDPATSRVLPSEAHEFGGVIADTYAESTQDWPPPARPPADGRLRLCLLREREVDLMTPLRNGVSDDQMKAIIEEGIWHKPWGHKLGQDVIPLNRVMSEIGG